VNSAERSYLIIDTVLMIRPTESIERQDVKGSISGRVSGRSFISKDQPGDAKAVHGKYLDVQSHLVHSAKIG